MVIGVVWVFSWFLAAPSALNQPGNIYISNAMYVDTYVCVMPARLYIDYICMYVMYQTAAVLGM